MSEYNPPLEDLPYFNTLMFGQEDDTVSPEEGDLLYLSKVNSTVSNSPNTTFNGQVVYNNVCPSINILPSLPEHAVNKNYLDNNFVDLTNNQTISGIKTFSVLPQTTVINPTLANELIRKDYVDLNFVDKTTTQIISGVKNFTNNAQFRGTLTYFDTQTPFSNNSQFFHIGVTSVIKNNANSGIITYNTRTSVGVASNVMEISSSFLRMFKPIRIIDTNSPFSQYTEIIQATNIISFSNSYNLGSYQFNTRNSSGVSSTILTIDNTGININGVVNGSLKSNDLTSINTTDTNNIYTDLTTGAINLGSLTSNLNILSSTTFSTLPLCSVNPNNANNLVNKNYTDTTFQTIANMANYLTIADASSTYQTIANMANYLTTASASSIYLTITNASSTYQTIVNMVNYLTTSSASSIYLTITNASSTYQTIANMVNYLTIADASSTYQTIANMTNYLTTASASSIYLTITNASSTYQTIANMANYLTITNASSTYQTIANMVNYLTITNASSTYLTIADASSTYQTIANMANYLTTASASSIYLTITNASSTYQTIANMANYLTITNASSTYQTIANMVNYLTITNASSIYLTIADANSTYQTIANMANYLTTASASSIYLTITNASSTYQTIANMANYLTIASASSTYQTISGMTNYVNTTTSQNISGLKTFLDNLEVYNASASLILRVSSGTSQQSTIKQNGSSLQIINNSTTPTLTYLISGANRLTISPTQFALDATCFLTTNDIKSRLPSSTHSLFSDITTGSISVASSTSTVNINGSTTFSLIPLCSVSATTSNQLVNFTTLNAQGFTTLPLVQGNANIWTNTNTFNAQATFNNICPISNTNASLNNHLTTLGFNDGRYVDFTTDQTISGTNKRFNGLFCTSFSITPTLGGTGNRQQVYITSTELKFNPLFNSNYYRFYCNDSLANNTNPFEISSATTIVRNNLIAQGSNTFGLFTSDTQDITGWLYLRFRTRIYDLSVGTNYTQMYMIGGNEFAIAPNANGDKISFYCKDATLGQINTFVSSALSNTSNVNLICNSTLTSNNLNAPTTTSTNNIYTNLIAGGIINLGSLLSTNTIAGNTTFSSDITTQNIFCETALYLSDFIPPSSSYSSILVQNADILNFDANFTNNKFQFKVSTNPVLLIDGTNTTFSNNLISNAQTTFNNFTPISNVSTPTANNHLVRKDYCDNNFMYKTGSINENITGEKNFQSNMAITGANGYFIINPNMSSGSFNPASETGTIGIIGLKDQTNDKFLLTLYGNIHASVKLNFSGVSIGFGGGSQIPNTQVLCNGTNVVIKPSLQFSGDNTIQNSAFTGAGPLNGTYNLANMTIDTNGKITSLSNGLSSNNNFTGVNTFSNGLTIKSSLLLKDTTNTLQGTVDMSGGGILLISSDNNSGKVQINTKDSGGGSLNRLLIDQNECNLTVPITLNLDYTYYNPANFTSSRLGYSMSNTGSTNTLTNNVANNSGQINIPAGSWNITYTATITVITNAITTLTSLELYVADSLTNDLNIIGINTINYYKISSVPVGQKMRISGSGNYISYTNVNTELNLRLLPLFTAGTGGLNFQGKISATRNA